MSTPTTSQNRGLTATQAVEGAQATQTAMQPNALNQITMPSIICICPRDFSSENKTYSLLKEDNWQAWQEDIYLLFEVCDLLGYIHGEIECPNESIDPVSM